MLADCNTAVLLTPPGSGAIGVVRISGSGVAGFLRDHFSRSVAVGRCVHGNLTDGERIIDDAVVVLCDNNTADINVHGGAWVIRSAIELAERCGFELLDAKRLPLVAESVDSKTPMAQEVLTHVPLARTELGLAVLLAQDEAWEKLKACVGEAPDEVREELKRIGADATLDHLLHPPTVAIVGPANVGKSTLANQLFAQERSITADVPGTTRDWVGEIANIDGLPVMLLDTPGLRETVDPIERTAIERSRERIGGSELVVLVLDATRQLSGDQSDLLRAYPKAICALNKCDRPTLDVFCDFSGIRTVATIGKGVDDLRSAIAGFFCNEWPVVIDRARCWTERQRRIVASAVADPAAIGDI